MKTIKFTFARAAASAYGFDTFVLLLLLFAIAILDDVDRREEQRRKSERLRRPHVKPPCP